LIFQYRDAQNGRRFFSGAKIGARFQKQFEPVKAQEFRLNNSDATEARPSPN